MDGQIDGKPVPHVLIDQGVVPFIKIDKGLEDEANGVQIMKPMPDLDALLTHSRALGVFGTKERSVINLANPEGIAAVVAAAVRSGAQGAGAGHGANHRTGSQHQEP
jgi:fructose-bisphosphate aldolase class I